MICIICGGKKRRRKIKEILQNKLNCHYAMRKMRHVSSYLPSAAACAASS